MSYSRQNGQFSTNQSSASVSLLLPIQQEKKNFRQFSTWPLSASALASLFPIHYIPLPLYPFPLLEEMTSSWDSMRKQARRLETDIEARLVEYSKLAASLQSSSRPSFEAVRSTTEGKPTSSRSLLISPSVPRSPKPLLNANLTREMPRPFRFPDVRLVEMKRYNDAPSRETAPSLML